jgi:hypothetical protein
VILSVVAARRLMGLAGLAADVRPMSPMHSQRRDCPGITGRAWERGPVGTRTVVTVRTEGGD